jgi:signal transduction histidine kinase
VQRHAHAAKVWLTLSYLADSLVLDVRDDGTGFEPTTPRVASATGGYGLDAMRQRVRRAGGTLAVESAVGEGTVISAALPIGSAS